MSSNFPWPETIIPEGSPGETTEHDVTSGEVHRLLNTAIVTVSGTTYTILVTDFGRLLKFTNAAAVTVTVPASTLPGGATGCAPVLIWQYGAGQVSLTQGASMTLRPASPARTRAQYSLVALLFVSTTESLAYGDLA